jgi:alkanesulfonate monooxygenase SsuD/methylene tetrahydromethanopterin reductase-like flavin-dependent oxidoreductase (luciferase family)
MVAGIKASTPELILANNAAFVGTPDEVCKQVEQCVDAFGPLEPSMQINFGGSSDWEAMRTLELIARHVMPKFPD